MTSTGVYHDRSGATEQARSLQRIAPNGNSYTEDQFAEWYGRDYYRNVWDSASSSCQDEQTAGAAEHNASAAQSADQVLQSTDAYPLQTGPQAGATEHSAPATQLLVLPIILEVRQLQAIRDAESRSTPKRSLHGLAREALNAFADAHYVGSTCSDALFPWKPYLASHPKGEMVVSPGITSAVVDQRQDVKDPNRGGRPRIDFIFYRVD